MAIGDTTANLQQQGMEATTFETYLTRYYEDIGAFVTAYNDTGQQAAVSTDWITRRNELLRLIAGQAMRFGREIAIGRQTRQWAPDILTRLDAYAADIERITGGAIARRDAGAPRPSVPQTPDRTAAMARIAALAANLSELSDAPGFNGALHDAARAQIEAAVAVATAAGADRLVAQYERYVGALQAHYANQKRMAERDATPSPDVTASAETNTAAAPEEVANDAARQKRSPNDATDAAAAAAVAAAAWHGRVRCSGGRRDAAHRPAAPAGLGLLRRPERRRVRRVR